MKQGLKQGLLSRLANPFAINKKGYVGIRPPEHKHESLALPPGDIACDEFYIPINNVNGEPMKLNVKVGDEVLAGQFINQVRENEKQYIAPSSGKIVDIKKILISGRVPYYSECLILVPDGKNQLYQTHDSKDYHICNQDKIINRIKRAAIYGMGGGGFPAWRKLSSGNIKHLIINAVECEPYITVDHALIETHSDEIISAISLVQEIIDKYNISDNGKKLQTHLAIEGNMGSAIANLRASLEKSSLNDTRIRVLPTTYPIGSEKQLVSSLLGQEIPVNQVTVQQGIICLNVATIRAIYRAVAHNEPLLKRLVTVSGNGVKQARNYWVTIGTPIKAIIKHLQLVDPDNTNIFLGGGMMNYEVRDINMPISSSTNCLLFFNNVNHVNNGNGAEDRLSFYKINGSASSPPISDGKMTQHRECIRCGLCEQVCPVNLLPQQLYTYVKANKFDLAEQEDLFSCIECAACNYVCPSNIPLSDYYIFAKEHIKAEKSAKQKADKARARFNDHKERIEKQKQEMKERRAARLAQMKHINKDSPAEELETKQRKIVTLKMQIDKTQQAVDKWCKAGEEDKTATLTQALEKLQQELKDLE